MSKNDVSVNGLEDTREENENGKLGEWELKDVAGGGFLNDNHCWFSASGESRTEESEYGNIRLLKKCSANCFNYNQFKYCGCHGQQHCQDKWHTVDENGKPVAYYNLASRNRIPCQ